MLRHLLQDAVETAWEACENLNPKTTGEHKEAVGRALKTLDSGKLRVAEPDGKGRWIVNDWLKKAVLLSFRLFNNDLLQFGAGLRTSSAVYGWDKVPLKTAGWTEQQFNDAGFRMVPGAVVRRSAFIGKGVVLMPSFVNVGAYVGDNTMVDTWATVGSCAQIGKNVHLSGGVGIGGVLEPLQANPTIIEDGCFIGARSEVVEGVIVGEGSVLGMGVFLGQSTPVWDRKAGKWLDASEGLKIPPYSVVISGQKPGKDPTEPSTYCAVIVKTVDAQTRSKTGINELLRG
jgi:2,3,4,5-tetrahydropyridine-2-carboxylate N-succinyltransferase